MQGFNDLIGLPYRWGAHPREGATDCLQLCGEARRRMGLHGYDEDFAWIYERWTEEDFPAIEIVRWARANGCKTVPQKGAIGYLKAANRGVALGTVLEDNDFLFITSGGYATRASLYNLPRIRLYWGRKDAGE